jgi:hypothetical protein
MRSFALSLLIAFAVFAPSRLHAQGVRCKDGTVWSAKKGRIVCGGHGGVVSNPRRVRARAAKGTQARRLITCKDNTTTNTPGPNPCARHGGVNKGSQTH